jgi:ribonuclease BN (tRNA processing enzyme)
MNHTLNFAAAILSFAIATEGWAACINAPGESRVQLQVLGAAGPRASRGSASASYLVWIDGVGRILIDAGGGTKVTFHQTGATFDDIDLVAISHLHPDHSAELPALLWPDGGSTRVAGPSAANVFPSIETFLEQLFGTGGAFEILAPRIELDAITVNASAAAPVEVWRDGDILVRGLGVPHGDVPTIGYRLDVGDASIAFASDQNGSNPAFIDLIEGVDVLVIHLGGPENSTGMIAALHAKPSVWGQMAADAGAGQVLVSHVSTPSPEELETRLGFLRETYSGPITVAEDLMCIDVQ